MREAAECLSSQRTTTVAVLEKELTAARLQVDERKHHPRTEQKLITQRAPWCLHLALFESTTVFIFLPRPILFLVLRPEPSSWCSAAMWPVGLTRRSRIQQRPRQPSERFDPHGHRHSHSSARLSLQGSEFGRPPLPAEGKASHSVDSLGRRTITVGAAPIAAKPSSDVFGWMHRMQELEASERRRLASLEMARDWEKSWREERSTCDALQ